jgi:micrococcal nuclease
MYEYRAKLKRVVDGDTVDFVVDLGFHVHTTIRTRLLGVDTPERGHPDWKKATAECARLISVVADVEGAEVGHPEHYLTIRTHKQGKYGRWLVEIDGVTDVLAETWPYEEKK